MKNILFITYCLFTFFFTGCATFSESRDALTNDYTITEKDTQPVKLVFYSNMFECTQVDNSYFMLLQEADRVGAHGIVNVSIEQSEFKDRDVCYRDVHASALAVRFLSHEEVAYSNPVYEDSSDEGHDFHEETDPLVAE